MKQDDLDNSTPGRLQGILLHLPSEIFCGMRNTSRGGELKTSIEIESVKLNDLFREQEIDQGGNGEKGAEGNPGLSSFFLFDHGQDPDKGTEKGAGKDDKGEGLPAQECADHGQQLDVSATHPFLLFPQVVEQGNGVENASSKEQSNKGTLPGECRTYQ
jgi:hypothetical protein